MTMGSGRGGNPPVEGLEEALAGAGQHAVMLADLQNRPERSMESARLKLRPFTLDDLDSLHSLWTDPDVRRYLWDNRQLSREETAAIIERSIAMQAEEGAGLWAVERREEPALIGFGGYWYFGEPAQLQILFGLHPRHWGMGKATELAECLIQYGFGALRRVRVIGATDRANVSSQRVMEKAGMQFVERIRTRDSDLMYYAIDKPQ
jgi:RimJ/RimL family protein N-acetyltransferase